MLISFPSDLGFIRGADLQDFISEVVPVKTFVEPPEAVLTQPTAFEIHPPTSFEETQGHALIVITNTICK